MRILAVGLAVTAAASVTLLSAPTAVAANQSISGSVTCINWLQQHSRPVGIWVDTNTRDGWAVLRGGTGMNGAWTSAYSFSADNGGRFTLNVGCGGTAQKWAASIKQGPFGPGVRNLTVRYW